MEEQEQRSKFIGIDLPGDLHDKLVILKVRKRVTQKQLIEDAIREMLERECEDGKDQYGIITM